MNWNLVIRHAHRWISIAFLATVIANIIAVYTGKTFEWLYLLPLLPLFLLTLSGLYMFFLPYVRRASKAPPTTSKA